jgi:hypothetical protein
MHAAGKDVEGLSLIAQAIKIKPETRLRRKFLTAYALTA